jgi:GDP-L-fucose synthase
MERSARIYVAGHRGLVGSAILAALLERGYTSTVVRTHAELDLIDAAATQAFFAAEKPEYVFLCAAKVGGILANDTFPADFIRENLAIEFNVITAAHRHGVKRLIYLGSSCIYPRMAPQPIHESALLTGPLEPTNRPYALAKIAGIELCWSYNRQYGTRFLAAMPTNLYGPNDNFHPQYSHVIPALVRRFYEARASGLPLVQVWGSGTPMREFLWSEDLADACLSLMNLDDTQFDALLGTDSHHRETFVPPLINIGSGSDLSIAELASLVAQAVGYCGRIEFDPTQPDGTPRKLMDSSWLFGLGWSPKVDLATGLARMVRLFDMEIAPRSHRGTV